MKQFNETDVKKKKNIFIIKGLPLNIFLKASIIFNHVDYNDG